MEKTTTTKQNKQILYCRLPAPSRSLDAVVSPLSSLRSLGCTDWTVTIYTSDPSLYEAQVTHQLQHAFNVIEGEFFISFTQKKSLSNRGRKLLKESLPHVEFDEAWSTFFLCENVFQS